MRSRGCELKIPSLASETRRPFVPRPDVSNSIIDYERLLYTDSSKDHETFFAIH